MQTCSFKYPINVKNILIANWKNEWLIRILIELFSSDVLASLFSMKVTFSASGFISDSAAEVLAWSDHFMNLTKDIHINNNSELWVNRQLKQKCCDEKSKILIIKEKWKYYEFFDVDGSG